MKTLLIDAERCIQCCNCQNACKDEHCDNSWPPLAAPQGPGQFWIQIHEAQSGDGSRIQVDRTPLPCQHCADAPCIQAGKGAVYRRDDGIVIIDPVKAEGMRDLVDACPYEKIFWNDELKLAQKCTLCAHLLDSNWQEPRCVTACPVDALSFVEEAELTPENLHAPLERLHPEYGTAPRVAYLNLPKPWVAGAVYCPDSDSCLEGVTVRLVSEPLGAFYTTTTDFLGEFKLKDVEPGIYRLTLNKEGYQEKTLRKVDAREGINVKELRLYEFTQ
ncbi:MAG: carboxypeptidase regulatory-like domain-containing protein [Coriobacteriales bacterium]|jgi:Fe-S-cluster-containing dehydrogenase component|nr:carboxypeptidase regulatory-like domain-containing protein [Coriobacteriales bacterium]